MKTLTFVLFSAALALPACKGKSEDSAKPAGEEGGGAAAESGVIVVDGSSTVLPVSQAVAEAFEKQSEAHVTVGKSGTGGGFQKFCRNEIVVTGASRPVKESERAACKEAGIEFIELPVAYDGIAVVVHKDNSWVDHLTVEELKTMWAPEAEEKVMNWSDIREGFPEENLRLFGPGLDSGTYDYFTKAIVGTEHASRSDFQPNEDDNVLVRGVSTDAQALGFFGFAYYKENTDVLKIVPIDDGTADNGDGPVAPTMESVADGSYQPLSRPIFIYVNKEALEKRPEVAEFVSFYLNQDALVEKVGYIPLPAAASELVKKRLEERTTGSLFEDGSKVGVTIEEILKGA
ncbi:PstS family phosphate ABC transporter substrate-binding protein [Haliangium ochraceum]|uniref:Phosphate-binding protein n=1 Tax=Haliangium ochraceum (strain DSM 14365 / JCM 11303 / SMP-2) TaxID=502025 RepID=D0LQ36_HALO1|nr:PstS family phosphate ABC transporter substrate-binding protein [Haliangium ochraceum]ACY17073.1 phosphate binding protein [Haliangium ochraceum DSM 14365]